MSRRSVLGVVASRTPQPAGDDCVLVGVTGIDGAGKTCFGDELAELLAETRESVIRVSVDDFHHPREHRYQLGTYSSEGYWLHAFDYDRLWSEVLTPLGPGGSRRYRQKWHDLATDELLNLPLVEAPSGSTVVVDGLFLTRPELATAWDLAVLLDVPFEITLPRMTIRDGTSSDPEDPQMSRYVGAQEIYFAVGDPRAEVDLVIDNCDLEHPFIKAKP